MAEDKKSFLVYADAIHLVKKLVENDRIHKTNNAGELFLHMLEYVNDNDPEPINMIVDISFEPMKQQLKRDLQKYRDKKSKYSEAGKASAEARKLLKEKEQNSTKSTNVENVDKRSTFSTVTDTDTVTVNVKDTVTVKDILLKKETKENNTPNGVVGLKNQHAPPIIDFENLVLFFNTNRGLMPEVKKLSNVRKKRILILEKEHGKKSIIEVIKKTRDSPFLQGDNDRGWVADFDWIFKPANFLKILEDNYEKRENTRSINSQRTDAHHKQSAVSAVNAMFGR